MKVSMLTTAAQLLRQQYGPRPELGDLYCWNTLVRVVTTRARSARCQSPVEDQHEAGPLGSARETSQASAAGLGEFLTSVGYPPRLAGGLRTLARWWLRDENRAAESAAGWDRPVDLLREELCSLPGINLALAERILLHVGGLAAFPIDRATIRIAARHGWVDRSAEYDEWQSFFCRGTDGNRQALVDLEHGFSKAGHEFCGTTPRCEGCPLQPLLPASGPVALMEEGRE